MKIQTTTIFDWISKLARVDKRETLVLDVAKIFRDVLDQKNLELLEIQRLGDRNLHLKIWDQCDSFLEIENADQDYRIIFWKEYFLKMEKELQDLRIGIFSVDRGFNEASSCFFIGLGAPHFYVLHFDLTSFGVKEQNLLQIFIAHIQTQSQLLYKVDQTQNLLFKDDLTGLYNHRYLESILDQEVKRSQRFQTGFCLLFMDIDNFKRINDQYGHPTGSDILKQVADLLRDTLREVDSIMRYGGDEFVILLLGATSASAFLAAERIRANIETKQFISETKEVIQITTSIGVAAFPEHAKSAPELLKLADTHMYQSKKSGKNKVSGFHTSIS